MLFRKKKDNFEKESVQKIQRKLEKLEDTGSVSSFTQRLRETWRKQNLYFFVSIYAGNEREARVIR